MFWVPPNCCVMWGPLSPSVHSTLDDEDEMLYGSSTVDTAAPVKTEPMDSAEWVWPVGVVVRSVLRSVLCTLHWLSAKDKMGGAEEEEEEQDDQSSPQPTHWCALCCQDGSLKVLSVV